jgi:hypothetical protein
MHEEHLPATSGFDSSYSPLLAQASVDSTFSPSHTDSHNIGRLSPIPEPARLVTQWGGIEEELLEAAEEDPVEPPEWAGEEDGALREPPV